MATTTDVGPTSPEATLRAGGRDEILAVAGRVGESFATRADRHDREGSYAAENITEVWESGLGNLTLPEELGGVGADLTTTAKALELLAIGDPSTTLILTMHLVFMRGLAGMTRAWPDHLRTRVISDSLAGPALINGLRVEPELGTPARGGVPATTARRAKSAAGEDVWLLNGRKIYSTGSYGLRWMNVWGATTEDDREGQRIGSFLVASDSPGIEIDETWDHLGMRATVSHDVVFHDVAVPFDRAIGLRAPGSGRDGTSDPESAPTTRGWMQVARMALYGGVAKASRDWLVGYLHERVPTNLGASLATLQRFQIAVGEIEALIYTNDRLIYGMAEAIDAGGEGAEQAASRAALMKSIVSANIIKSTELALSLIGNPGLSHHHPLQRHFRNALCSRVHTPQDDVVLAATGRGALGL